MIYFHLSLLLGALALAGFIVYDFTTRYRAATGSIWERMLAAGQGTETLLWARFVALVGAVSGLLVSAADYANAPGVATAIQQFLQPEYVAIGMVAIALITEWARRHRADDLK